MGYDNFFIGWCTGILTTALAIVLYICSDTKGISKPVKNTGSLPLCRSCIKLHACTDASDITQVCGKHERYGGANGYI